MAFKLQFSKIFKVCRFSINNIGHGLSFLQHKSFGKHFVD